MSVDVSRRLPTSNTPVALQTSQATFDSPLQECFLRIVDITALFGLDIVTA